MMLQKRFHVSKYETERPVTIGKNTKATELMKNKFSANIMTEFVRIRKKLIITYQMIVVRLKKLKEQRSLL